jgi:general secretion pathway protein J
MHKQPARTLRGFTLVELLVALFALALLAILSWRGLDAMVRGQSQLQDRADQVLSLQAGLAQWTADLEALEVLPEVNALDWNGQVLRLVRRSAGDTRTGADGVVVAAWAQRATDGQGRWWRWQSEALTRRADVEQAWLQAESWARDAGRSDRAREVPVMPLDAWRLWYFRDAAWREAVPADAAAADPSRPPPPLPDGVRLVLTLPAGGPLAGDLTLDWVSPLATPRRS